MIARSALLLAAALLGAPALAQDDASGPPPLPPLEVDASPAPDYLPSAEVPLSQHAVSPGWQGEWQGEWAEDGTWRGTWQGTYSDPGPSATRVIDPAGPAPTGYGAVERTNWLNQCRTIYYPGSPATGAVIGTQTDVCEAYLQQYERSYAMAAQAPTVSGRQAPLPVAPGAYAPAGYGYAVPPVMWVRVPIVRQPVGPARTEGE